MIIKACLFDLDGVLVDTARFHYIAWKQLADKLGFSFSESDNERLKGISRMSSLEILLDIGKIKLSEEQKSFYATAKNEVYLSYIRRMTPQDVLPGVIQFLKELKNNNILTGVGSASKNATLILERTNLGDLFDVIVDGNLVSNAKPDPEVFIKGAKMLGIDNGNCVVFEDAVAGIQAARHAGMKSVGIGSPAILHEADMVIPGFEKLELRNLVL